MVEATGGTISDIVQKGTNYRVHSFTATGQLDVTVGGTIEYLIVGGGGAGGNGNTGGGGGAGRLIYGFIDVAPGLYDIVVGAGGAIQTTYNAQGNDGLPSSAFGISAPGGGGGGGGGSGGTCANAARGRDGGSGGGGGGTLSSSVNPCPGNPVAGTYPAGHTPLLDVGFRGGYGLNNAATSSRASGGGGGCDGIGQDFRKMDVQTNSGRGGYGGMGLLLDITGTFSWYAAGGQGGTNGSDAATYPNTRARTNNISGYGAAYTNPSASAVANTGAGGGGGSDNNRNSGAGGSGIVIIRYNTSEIAPYSLPFDGYEKFTPAQQSGLKLWIDAADASTVTLNGEKVASITDKSGNGLTLSNGTDAYRPVYAQNVLKGLSVLRFGPNQSLGNSNRVLDSNILSIFLVSKTADNAYILVGDSVTTDFCFCVRTDEVSSIDSLGSSANYWMDGVAQTWTNRQQPWTPLNNDWHSVALVNKNFTLWDGAFWLSGYNSAFWRLDGDIGEVIVISGTIDQLTIDRIFGYLAHKWGTDRHLPDTHPFKYETPVRPHVKLNIEEHIIAPDFKVVVSDRFTGEVAGTSLQSVTNSVTDLIVYLDRSDVLSADITVFPDHGSVWQANSSYVVGDKVTPSDLESYPIYLERQVDGVSGASEPLWTSTIDTFIDDGAVVGAWKVIDLISSPNSHTLSDVITGVV